VGTFSGIGDTALAYADQLQRAVAAADAARVTAWIVDVRGNGGGNMWPMLAGVGPLLGEGVIGFFIDPVGQEVAWHYRDGASWEGASLAQRVSAPYTLRQARSRVAVLTDAGTASSGEATVIAFRGRLETRSFGTPTCGLSTAIENYALSDGARLNLAISVMADRTRAKYGEAVSADEFILDPAEVVARAIEWLQERR
jgi:C-terminal processing protease CtpA/Prc